MAHVRWFAVLLGILAGCSGEDATDAGEPSDGAVDGDADTDVDSDSDTDPTEPTGDAPTFAEDVRPMLGASCARCHGESLLAPQNFLDYDTAKAWAEVMLVRIDAGEMPPPAADPACHPYQGAEVMQMDPALPGMLRSWIDGGYLAGDLENAPEVSVWVPPTLSRRDVELRTAAPYTPQFVEGNEYRCFVIDDNIDADVFVTGIEFLLDHPTVSHHALLFVDPDGGNEANIEDPATKSWVCPEVLPEVNWETLHAWAPSGGAVEFPAGKGIRVRRGGQVILQMHYFAGTTEPVVDQPGYALMVAPTVDDELFYLPLGPDSFTIPAGAASHTETEEYPLFWFSFGQVDFDVYGVMPHMHVLGTGYEFKGVEGGTESCISRSDAYDFSNQPTYWFDEPVRVSGTGDLSVSCTWNNSAENPRQLNDPPLDVTWGENTQQEMCFALMYVAAVPR